MDNYTKNDAKEKLNPEAVLRRGQAIQMSPQGYSMYPLLIPGRDTVVIEPINAAEEGVKNTRDKQYPKRGDIVLFRREGSILVLHRIISVKESGYYLVGDNQTEIEGPIKAEQICGIVSTIVRKGKEIDVKNGSYRFFCGVWLFLRPIRPAISKTIHFFKTIGRKH